MRKPTEAERRAIQHAVDAGDWDRARELLAALRRRVSKTKTRRSAPKTSAKRGRASTKARVAPRASTASKPAPVARKKATPKPAKKKAKLPAKRCTRCGEQFRPTGGRQLRCSVCSPNRASTSVRTLPGGLPGLGKRR